MRTRLIRLLRYWSFLALFFALSSFALAFTSPGNPTGYVNDFASVLSPEQKTTLETTLKAFNASTSNEIAIVTIKSLDGDYIEHYAEQLFKLWGIGDEKKDNGVLLLIAVDDHQMRIEVGYGLEGVLTDAIASSIIRNDLTPAFKQNDFFGGINKAVNNIIAATQGEYTVPKEKKTQITASLLETLFVTGIVVIQFLASVLGRSKSWWLGGVIGGILGSMITSLGFLGLTMVTGSLVIIALIVVGLIFDYIVSTSYAAAVSRGSSIPWWVGGGGGSGSGRSFGGFGGGSSGGGGASGSW